MANQSDNTQERAPISSDRPSHVDRLIEFDKELQQLLSFTYIKALRQDERLRDISNPALQDIVIVAHKLLKTLLDLNAIEHQNFTVKFLRYYLPTKMVIAFGTIMRKIQQAFDDGVISKEETQILEIYREAFIKTAEDMDVMPNVGKALAQNINFDENRQLMQESDEQQEGRQRARAISRRITQRGIPAPGESGEYQGFLDNAQSELVKTFMLEYQNIMEEFPATKPTADLFRARFTEAFGMANSAMHLHPEHNYAYEALVSRTSMDNIKTKTYENMRDLAFTNAKVIVANIRDHIEPYEVDYQALLNYTQAELEELAQGLTVEAMSRLEAKICSGDQFYNPLLAFYADFGGREKQNEDVINGFRLNIYSHIEEQIKSKLAELRGENQEHDQSLDDILDEALGISIGSSAATAAMQLASEFDQEKADSSSEKESVPSNDLLEAFDEEEKETAIVEHPEDLADFDEEENEITTIVPAGQLEAIAESCSPANQNEEPIVPADPGIKAVEEDQAELVVPVADEAVAPESEQEPDSEEEIEEVEPEIIESTPPPAQHEGTKTQPLDSVHLPKPLDQNAGNKTKPIVIVMPPQPLDPNFGNTTQPLDAVHPPQSNEQNIGNITQPLDTVQPESTPEPEPELASEPIPEPEPTPEPEPAPDHPKFTPVAPKQTTPEPEFDPEEQARQELATRQRIIADQRRKEAEMAAIQKQEADKLMASVSKTPEQLKREQERTKGKVNHITALVAAAAILATSTIGYVAYQRMKKSTIQEKEDQVAMITQNTATDQTQAADNSDTTNNENEDKSEPQNDQQNDSPDKDEPVTPVDDDPSIPAEVYEAAEEIPALKKLLTEGVEIKGDTRIGEAISKPMFDGATPQQKEKLREEMREFDQSNVAYIREKLEDLEQKDLPSLSPADERDSYATMYPQWVGVDYDESKDPDKAKYAEDFSNDIQSQGVRNPWRPQIAKSEANIDRVMVSDNKYTKELLKARFPGIAWGSKSGGSGTPSTTPDSQTGSAPDKPSAPAQEYGQNTTPDNNTEYAQNDRVSPSYADPINSIDQGLATKQSEQTGKQLASQTTAQHAGNDRKQTELDEADKQIARLSEQNRLRHIDQQWDKIADQHLLNEIDASWDKIAIDHEIAQIDREWDILETQTKTERALIQEIDDGWDAIYQEKIAA